MNEPRAHYAEWNKPDRARQIMHGVTSMSNLKRNQTHGNSIEK